MAADPTKPQTADPHAVRLAQDLHGHLSWAWRAGAPLVRFDGDAWRIDTAEFHKIALPLIEAAMDQRAQEAAKDQRLAGSEVMVANACLIAAAPALLEALKANQDALGALIALIQTAKVETLADGGCMNVLDAAKLAKEYTTALSAWALHQKGQK